MGRTTTDRGKRRAGIASHLLFILLASSLFHSSLHIFGFANDSEFLALPQSAIQKQPPQGAGSNSSTVLPCLACNCQKHNFAVLSSHDLTVGPTHADYFLIEVPKTFKEQPCLNLNLSRAPPLTRISTIS